MLDSLVPNVRNFPTIFEETLAKHLKDLHLEEGTLCQYVDNTLTTSSAKGASDKNTINTLNYLANKGYKKPKKEAQISQAKVTYLGFVLTVGKRTLPQERKEAIFATSPLLKLGDHLGVPWDDQILMHLIPNYGLIASLHVKNLRKKMMILLGGIQNVKGPFKN